MLKMKSWTVWGYWLRKCLLYKSGSQWLRMCRRSDYWKRLKKLRGQGKDVLKQLGIMTGVI